jgi:hypothetical protein
MLLGYLIFAHLLGDFVFQPEKLVQLKMKSVKGVFIHVFIHFVIGMVILAPFILNGYEWLVPVILGICFFHFWIDQAKINYDLKHDKKVRPFVIDQLLHLLTLLLAYFFTSDIELVLPEGSFYEIYTNINVIIVFSFVIFLSAAVETYRYQILREKNAKAKFNPNPKKILRRISVFSIIYALFMLLALYATKKI